MSNLMNFGAHVAPEEVVNTLSTGYSQVINRLIHEPEALADARYYHAKGLAARLTHKWGVFMELAAQERSTTNAVRLLMFMEGASGSEWLEALSRLGRCMRGEKTHTVKL